MIASSMILIGYLLILGLAGYWMRRAAKAERRAEELEAESRETVERLEQETKAADAREHLLRLMLSGARVRFDRIISLETPNMAHVGKKAVAIAKGER